MLTYDVSEMLHDVESTEINRTRNTPRLLKVCVAEGDSVVVSGVPSPKCHINDFPVAMVSVKTTVSGKHPEVSLITPLIADRIPEPTPASSKAIFKATSLQPAPLRVNAALLSRPY